jgi:hypothetical protein
VFGLTIEEASGPAVEIWPDNLQSVNFFISVCSQWRHNGFTVTGLDYGVFPAVLRMTGIPRKDWASVFDDVRIMEDAALAQLRVK